jgi:hypothetical protein
LVIQAKVRHLGKTAGSADQRSVEKDRDGLAAFILQLSQAQQAAGIAETVGPLIVEDESLHVWDEVFDEPAPDGSSAPAPAPARALSDRLPLPIEQQMIALPSNGNVDPIHCSLELQHRIILADHHLDRIRELIAKKSFQYSHVIRCSPRKSVTTRSRAAVKKLNLEIAVQCRLYARCRARIVRLGADPGIQTRLRPLSPNDVRASTAIINPNEPGSTRLRLSWIWQTAGGPRFGLAENAGAGADDSASTRECKFSISRNIYLLIYSIVQRVHWLRARAQFLRWQEEVTLINYEMQWTVRFFIHKSRSWAEIVDRANSPKAGGLAYARRKHAMWEGLARKADRTFTLLNAAYKSPL